MNKERMENKSLKDFSMLGDIFDLFKLANKYFNIARFHQ